MMDEDGYATASSSHGDIQRSEFPSGIAGDTLQRGNSGEGSDEDAPLPDEVFMSPSEIEETRNKRRLARLRLSLSQMELNVASSSLPPFAPPPVLPGLESPSGANTPVVEHHLLAAERQEEADPGDNPTAPEAPYLSLGRVLQGKKDYKLQNVEPFFTDPTGLYYNAFDKKLDNLNPKNSEGHLCIEEYLMKSERDWFQRFRNVKMGRSPASTPASSIFRMRRDTSGGGSPASSSRQGSFSDAEANDNNAEQFLLQEDYKPPTGIRKCLLYRIGTWPAYSFLLALVRLAIFCPKMKTDMRGRDK